MSPFFLPNVQLKAMALLFVVAVGCSLLFNGKYYQWFSLSWLFLFGWFALQLIQQKYFFRVVRGIHIIAILSIAWLFLANSFHPSPWFGAVFGWRFATFFFAMGVAYFLYRDTDFKSTFAVLIVLGLLLAIYTFFQSFYLGIDQAGATFFNKNQNGAFLNLFILPVMAALLVEERDKLTYSIFLVLFFVHLQGVIGGQCLAPALGIQMVAQRKQQGQIRFTDFPQDDFFTDQRHGWPPSIRV